LKPMPTEREYENRIEQFDREDLISLWERVHQKDRLEDWDPGKAFEYLVLRAFELEGATVSWPFSVRWPFSGSVIEQIDGAIFADGLSCLVESKDREEPLSFEPIAKMRNQLLRRPASAVGLVVSSGGFTAPARLVAHFLAPQTVLLWDGEEIDYCLRRSYFRQGLREKYQHAVEQGLPDYNVIERTIQ